MIRKYSYGKPFQTDAVVENVAVSEGMPAYGTVKLENKEKKDAGFSMEDAESILTEGDNSDAYAAMYLNEAVTEDGFCYSYEMGDEDIVYGLGENVRGINKRGFIYISNCSDISKHLEDARSLYAAHNFVIVDGKETFGLFVDYPGFLTFDIGYTNYNTLTISCEKADLDLYVIEGDTPYDIVKQFRKIIGRSYIPPKFAFGFGQSRWGYETKDDFRKVIKEHREAGIPLDTVYMDIDYMEDYKDFTLNEKEMSDFPAFVQELKEEHIRLIPIIDAGVKIEKGYDVYEEGVEKGYFCKKADGSEFVACVWPGWTHFPDVLNPKARKWFGDKYQILTDQGIEGFWNDMNEPAIFYTPETLKETGEIMKEHRNDPEKVPSRLVGMKLMAMQNNPEDYARMYHNVNGELVCHKDVHNLFGYNMTRAAGEAFERFSPDKRILIFSRSSYVGMHRYGGIWQGDNMSWWSHLALNLRMMPSLNMVGFLYTGADLGGFGSDTSRDLVLRWLALGVFTPLMRNHSAKFTRLQEFYRFEKPEDFKAVIDVRYRLIPYLYSEFMKAALRDDMMFKPLSFEYPKDRIARRIEDQMMIGNEIMIAPVITQNADGRVVYLPEEMHYVKFLADGSIHEEVMEKGLRYIEVALNEVPLFIRKGHMIPVAEAAQYVDDINTETMTMIGYEGASYELYEDDGFTRDYDNPENLRMLTK